MDVVVASSEADHTAVEAIKDHHAAMAGALSTKVTALMEAVRRGGDASAARDAVVDWSRRELVPHVLAEEETVYAAAGALSQGRLLVEALVAENRVLLDLIDQVARTSDALAAASAATSLENLFLAHLTKENDQVLPLLAADPSVALAQLLDGMREDVGGHQEAAVAAAAATGSGCGCGCSCGEQGEATDVELDAREVPHAIRHATIFGALDGLEAGSALVLIAPHDPLPLLAQLEQRSPGVFEVSYLERGPEAWRLRLFRRAA